MFDKVFLYNDFYVDEYLSYLMALLHQHDDTLSIMNPVVFNDVVECDEPVFDFTNIKERIAFTNDFNQSRDRIIKITRESSNSDFAWYYSRGRLNDENRIDVIEDIFILNPALSVLCKTDKNPISVFNAEDRERFKLMFNANVFRDVYLFYIKRTKNIKENTININMVFINYDGSVKLLIDSIEEYHNYVK